MNRKNGTYSLYNTVLNYRNRGLTWWRSTKKRTMVNKNLLYFGLLGHLQEYTDWYCTQSPSESPDLIIIWICSIKCHHQSPFRLTLYLSVVFIIWSTTAMQGKCLLITLNKYIKIEGYCCWKTIRISSSLVNYPNSFEIVLGQGIIMAMIIP